MTRSGRYFGWIVAIGILTLGCVGPNLGNLKPAGSGGVHTALPSLRKTKAPAALPTQGPNALPTQAPPVRPTQTPPPASVVPTLNPNTPVQLPAEMSGSPFDPGNKPFLALVNHYSDPKNLYSLDYPVGWLLSKKGGWNNICLDRDESVCFGVQTTEIPKNETLSTFRFDTYELFKVSVADYNLINREETTLGGAPAVMFEHGYSFQGEYYQGFAAYLINNQKGSGYSIQSTIKGEMEDYDLYYATLWQMLHSISVGG